MPRWEPDAVGRLQEAALELFEQRGPAGTTVAEIARRAGLTERSFFNHFATKADVLFGPRAERHREVVVRAIADSPATLPPLDAVVHGLQVAADELFGGLREASLRRRRIIDADPALREREYGKSATLTAAVADVLRARGLAPDAALMTARAGMLVQQTAQERWTRPGEDRPLRAMVAEALRSLRAATAAGSSDEGRAVAP